MAFILGKFELFKIKWENKTWLLVDSFFTAYKLFADYLTSENIFFRCKHILLGQNDLVLHFLQTDP